MSTPNLYPRLAASFFGTIFIGFGINAIVNPASALSFFELKYSTANKQLIDSLSAVYGVRDIFMGLAIYTAAYFGTNQTLGVITAMSGGIGVADGVICKVMVGTGEWNHWAYTPVVMGLGAYLAMS